jgi:hypothetical protein
MDTSFQKVRIDQSFHRIFQPPKISLAFGDWRGTFDLAVIRLVNGSLGTASVRPSYIQA